MKLFKLLRSLFILGKIKRITAGQVTLQTYSNEMREELMSKPIPDVGNEKSSQRISFLVEELTKTNNKIQSLEKEKKELQLKLN